MHTIIVPTDFSPVALACADYAVELALKLGARVILFHAFHMSDEERTSSFGLFAKRKCECQEKMTEEQNRLTGKSTVSVETVCDYGPVDALIARLAQRVNADLVVVGSKNYVSSGTGVRNRLATTLINTYDLPVLTIPYKTFPQTIARQVS